MKLKKNIKKIGALAGTGLMATLGVASPVAADLGDLPQPFVQDGEFNGNIVVGEEAATADVIGAIDMAASFQAEATSPVTVSSGGSVTVEGGELLDDNAFNDPLSGETLDDRDLDGFADSSVSFDSDNIDYEEVTSFSDSAFEFQTSLQNDDFEGEPYLTVPSNSINYSVVLGDSVDESQFEDDEMDLPFLGTDLEVDDIDVDNDELTVTTSNEQFLEAGDTVEVDGHTVELVRVAENSAIVEVDGQREVISDGSDQQFNDAGNFEVEVDGVFYVEGADDNGANLNMGGELSRTVSNNDPAELFGEPDDDREAEWVWNVNLGSGNSTDEGAVIGLRNNHDYTDLDINEDREQQAVAEEETIDFPNNYLDYTFQQLQVEEMATVNVEAFQDETVYPETGDSQDLDFGYRINVDEQIIEASGQNGSEEGSELLIGHNGDAGLAQVWVYDGDDDVLVEESANISDNSTWYDNTDISLDLEDNVNVHVPVGSAANSENTLADIDEDDAAGMNHLRFEFVANEGPSSEVLGLVTGDNDYFGPSDEEEGGDLVYNGTGGTTTLARGLGNEDYDLLTNYGVSISDPESQFGSGSSFTMDVPAEEQLADLSVTTRASQVGAGSGDTDAVEVNPIPLGLGVLDSSVTSNGELTADQPLIVVGGPYINTAASALLGNPSDSEVEEMFTQGQARVRMFDDEQALLVAGYTADDTERASQFVADFQNNADDLTGDEVELVFDGSEDVTVREPSEMDDSEMNGSEMNGSESNSSEQ